MSHNRLLGIFAVLVLALILSIWLTNSGESCPTANHYYVQVWLPGVLFAAVGAWAMHTNHMWHVGHASAADSIPDHDGSGVWSDQKKQAPIELEPVLSGPGQDSILI